MLRSVGRRGWASIGKYAPVSRILSSVGSDVGSGAAVDQNSTGFLGLGFSGTSGQQAKISVGRPSSFFPCHVNEMLRNGSCAGAAGATGPGQLNQVRRFIQLRTNLEVADNSGARRVQCIKVMKGSNAAQIGDTIMASVKDAQPRGKVKKGEVVTCVVVRAATHKLRRDGSEIKFDKNAVVLVNKQGEPIGTRIFGPVPHELRRRKLVKILTLAEHVA